jgi:hypothetical protein
MDDAAPTKDQTSAAGPVGAFGAVLGLLARGRGAEVHGLRRRTVESENLD